MKQKQNLLVIILSMLIFAGVVGGLQWFVAWQDTHYTKRLSHEVDYTLPNAKNSKLTNAQTLAVILDYPSAIKFKSDVLEAGGLNVESIAQQVTGVTLPTVKVKSVEKRVYHSENGQVVTAFAVTATDEDNDIEFEYVPNNQLIVSFQWIGQHVAIDEQQVLQNWQRNIKLPVKHTAYLADGEISQMYSKTIDYRLTHSQSNLLLMPV
ncbi:hypothetical protein WDV13_02680 [Weissella cibaria]|jgi:hypothetical protein|uniref:hypothetical protein n=1 Tax=Weissella cibaria TaxID=137591 RepID=UPI000E516688|nr:hypothetical protein [Weissella cibaria]MCQ9620449.1 hypothetical protein [Weissella cibaria]RGO80863.1 hypothetical protein DXA89_02630 [Weissella cibaria]RHE71059.1 hypothetical protein DW718_08485 [Weissella cibaria]RHE76703.1 hypothetical protein DW717_08840 [Weissella cibaria]